MRVLVVDAANVIGSRPDGWWKDRAAASRRLHERLLVVDLDHDQVVLVLEGQARGAARRGVDGHVVTAVTADGMLRARLEGLGAQVVGPSWLLEQLDPVG